VRDDGRLVDGKVWKERVYNRGMEEAHENSNEPSHSAHASGMNE
jgi:LAS superfamily LD-carboxypeptidase LdcB